MKFLADENFPFPSIKILRQAEYDVTSVLNDTVFVGRSWKLYISKDF